MYFHLELLVAQALDVLEEVARVLELLQVDVVDIDCLVILERPNVVHGFVNVTLYVWIVVTNWVCVTSNLLISLLTLRQ